MVTILGSAAGAAAILLKDEEKRARAGRAVREMYAKMTHRTASETQKNRKKRLGLSDPYDYEDNKMLSEGALTSVQYYNNRQQKEPVSEG